MLVFAVLMDRTGLTAASGADLAHVAAAPPVSAGIAPAWGAPAWAGRSARRGPTWITANGDTVGGGRNSADTEALQTTEMVPEATKSLAPGVVVVHK
jgi:uncharacterized protein involved in copper resistance